jgi:hypothetical protein
MTTDNKFSEYAIVAGADLDTPASRFKAVTIGGTIAASVTYQAAGILRHGGKTGETLGVVYEGITKVIAGAAISSGGVQLKITTSGYIITAVSGDLTIGRSLNFCASGDLVQAFVDFKNIGYKPT